MFKEKQVKMARMGEVGFGITDGTEEERARKAIVACEDFFRRMGLKTRLGECGIAEKDLDALAFLWTNQGWKLGEHHNIDSRVAREIMAFTLVIKTWNKELLFLKQYVSFSKHTMF